MEAVQNGHQLRMVDRKVCIISGVTDTISFQPEEAIMVTTLGELRIKGKELHVKQLSIESGTVEIEGTFDAVIYGKIQGKKKESVRKKWFYTWMV